MAVVTEQLEIDVVPECDPPPLAVAHTLCGCQYRIAEDGCYVLPDEQCGKCRHVSEEAEVGMRRMLDHELDAYVVAAAGGKRVKALRAPDPFKGG